MNYSLVQGTDILARVLDPQLDMPWYYATFDPSPVFDDVREVFVQALQFLQQDDYEELGSLWDELLANGLRLVPEDGSPPIDDFMLHVDGASCWFRF